jgi:hypothetical protein
MEFLGGVMPRGSLKYLPRVVFAGFLLLCIGIYIPAVFAEDGLVEMGSAVIFAAVATISAYCYLVGRERGSLIEQATTAFLAPVALILALSEVSFGARIGLFAPPAMYGGGEFDGGHDLLILALRLVRDGHVPVSIFVALVGMLLAGGWALWHWRHLVSRAVSGIISNPFLLPVAISLSLLALAIVLDLKSHRYLSLIEETLEFMSAAIFLLAVGARVTSLKRGDTPAADVVQAYVVQSKMRR